MKYLSHIFALAFLLAVAAVTAGAQGAAANYVPDELLVQVGPVRGNPQIAAAHAKVGGKVKKNFDFIGWQLVKLPPGMSVADGVRNYKAQPGVLNVEPNYLLKATRTPNDPSYSQLWAMPKIGAPAAWDSTVGTDVVVGVIDSGVDYTHPDLAANMWRNTGEIAGNGIDDDGDGYKDDVYGIDASTNTGDPTDANGHGTHVAGTIGAVGNNSVGVAGINWQVKIMALRFMDATGSGATSDAIECYQYAINMRKRGVNIRAVNDSWGGGGYSSSLLSAINTAASNGILSAVAAGNSAQNIDTTPSYPAAYTSDGIVSVAASDRYDNMASFSNYGTTGVDLAAPGVSIYSTYPGNRYATLSGTSMASPHVAGAAALVAAQNPALSTAQIKSILLSTVDVLSQFSGKVASGGRLNLAKAIAAAGGNVVTPPPPVTGAFGISSILPNPFDPNAGSTTITYTVPATADYTIVVKNGSGSTVRTLASKTGIAAGTYSQAWDGKDNSGTVAANGTYTVTISGTASGTTASLTPASATVSVNATTTPPPTAGPFGISSISPNPFNPAAQTTTITYTVPTTANYSVVVRNSSGSTIRTLTTRTGVAAGTYSIIWDGKNSSNVVVANGTYTVYISGTVSGTTTAITPASATVSVQASTTPPPTAGSYQPDLLVRTSAGTYVGDNIYSGTQSVSSPAPAVGASVTYYVRIQNDGTASDSFRLNGTSGGTGWTVAYYTSSGTNITSAMFGGSVRSYSMAPGAAVEIRVVVTRTSTATASSTITVRGVSATSTTKSDTVQMVTVL